MTYRSFILSFFFFLFIVTSPPPAHAKIGDVRGPIETQAEGPVEIEAEELSYDRETQTYEAHGQVEVNRKDLSLKADHARLNMATKELMAWGNVLLREGEDVVECQRLEVNIESRVGRIYQAKLYLKDQNFHIRGQEIEKLGENHYRVRDASMTTCDAKRPPWKFSVKEIEIKEMALGGWGTAKGVLFYLEDIPVLYLPWGTLPVRLERQTGFLTPRVGHSSSNGFEAKAGFYWAPTKNMDATYYQEYLQERGFKEGLEFRYALTRETTGEAHFYFINDQSVPNNIHVPAINGQTIRRDRYAFFIKHQQGLPYDAYLKGDVNHVSDHQYVIDFDEDIPGVTWIEAQSSRQMRSVLFGGKNWDRFSFLSQGVVFDDMTKKSNDETVQKLPQVFFNAHPQSLFRTPLFGELTSSFSNFYRGKGVEGQRWDLFPNISFPTRFFNVLKFESGLGLRETVYHSYNDPTGKMNGWNSREMLETNVQMSTEFYRVYAGETFQKISDLFSVRKWMHTIEPKVIYTYIPRVNQTHLPNFDQVDQIPYTNQVTYGVTQKLVGKPKTEGVGSGPSEYGKLMIYQSYSFGDPFTDKEGKKRTFSNIKGELWWNFTPYLSAHWDAELSPYRWSFDTFDFSITAKDRRNDAISVQYRYTRDTISEINILGRVKIFDPLYIYGGFYYNLLLGTWLYAILGAEYQTQCWSAGFIFQDRNRSPYGTQKSDLKFSAYVTLLNIGAVGKKPSYMNL